jgi:hypothetical protein
LGRTGIGADNKSLGVDCRKERREQHIGKAVAGEEVDPIGFDQLVRSLLADIGFLRVVLVDDLDRTPRHLPT